MEFIKGLNEGKRKALEVAEDSRETEWTQPSFLAQLFTGKLDWHLITPFPHQSEEDKKIGDEYCAKLTQCLLDHIDPLAVDRTGEIPQKAMDELAKIGSFALKIPKEYGGLGLSQVNYNRAMMIIASHCASTCVLLSAHQSIGVPQPLLLFGTPEQKQKYLPRFAKGAISAFALTEPDVGSDPAKMTTIAMPTEDGNYVLNGEKLWCTNGAIADIMVVMAQTPVEVKGKIKNKITAFIVEKDMPGFEVVHRCRFMGLNGIQNGLLRFHDVKVPKENVLGGVGRGLKLALVTLNTGRLTVPAAVTGAAKWSLNIARKWSNERVQWGSPIGEHDAIAHKLAGMNASTFAMESVTWLSSSLVDRKDTDIRLEAAMAKLFCTEASWRIADELVQIRGGRGYETADSLIARGEPGIPVERALRDMRINLIIEGTSEIMRLFIAREAMDKHLQFIFPLINPKIPMPVKLSTFVKAAKFYSLWYPKQWLFWAKPSARLGAPKILASHFDFVEKTAHKLGRELFHAMIRYQDGLEKKQRVLFRIVNVGCDLFAISATCSRALYLYKKNPSDKTPLELANLFSREAERRVTRQFHGLFLNDDNLSTHIAQDFLAGKMEWLEKGIIPFFPEEATKA